MSRPEPPEPSDEPVAPGRAVVTADQVRSDEGRKLWEEDSLDFRDQVDCFAKLLAARDVKPPLSIGLFGDWGMGKSYFIGMMQERIKELTQAAREEEERAEKEAGDGKAGEVKKPVYVTRAAQIGFNAWHYMDTSLWACLAKKIFDGLAEEIKDTLPGEKGKEGEKADNLEEARRMIRSEIQSSQAAISGAKLDQANAVDARKEAARQLEESRRERESKEQSAAAMKLARSWAAVMKANGSALEEAGKTAERLGFKDAVKGGEEVARAYADLRRLDGSVQGLLTALGARFSGAGNIALTLAVIIGVLVLALLPSLQPDWFKWAGDAAGKMVLLIAQVAVALGPPLTWAGRQLRAIRSAASVFEEATAAVAREEAGGGEPVGEEKKLLDEVRELDSKIQKNSEQVKEAEKRIAESEAEIQRLASGGLVYDFVSGQGQDPRYVKRMGLISLIRRDFEELEKLLDDWGQGGEGPIERIILYIDDLDRCPAERVVDVLQAVYLLLAMDLFNVVVAVDARWLVLSLDEKHASKEKGRGGFSAHDYLEKIFQVPFSLPEMSEKGFSELIDRLIETREEREKSEGVEATQTPASSRVPEAEAGEQAVQPLGYPDFGGEVGVFSPATMVTSAEAGGLDDSPLTGKESEPVMTEIAEESFALEQREQEFMQKLHGFVRTPRQAKRLVNLYALLRVLAAKKNFKEFVNEERGEYRAAQLLLVISIGTGEAGAKFLRELIAYEGEAADFNTFLAKLVNHQVKPPQTFTAEEMRTFGMILFLCSKLGSDGGGLPAELKIYQRWAREVIRYSFRCLL
ncbi:MAG TPA: P-loop NTPase fold protein [bacterium]|nr:P-loop NTPase fold protein [bacterium]